MCLVFLISVHLGVNKMTKTTKHPPPPPAKNIKIIEIILSFSHVHAPYFSNKELEKVKIILI